MPVGQAKVGLLASTKPALEVVVVVVEYQVVLTKVVVVVVQVAIVIHTQVKHQEIVLQQKVF